MRVFSFFLFASMLIGCGDRAGVEIPAPGEDLTSEVDPERPFLPPTVSMTQECDGVTFVFETVPANADRYSSDLFCVAKDSLIVSINVLEPEIQEAALEALSDVTVYVVDTNRYDFGAVGLVTESTHDILLDAWVFDELWHQTRMDFPDREDDYITARGATAFFGLVAHEMLHLVEIELGEADIECPHCSHRWGGEWDTLEGTARRTVGLSVFDRPNSGIK